MTKSLCAFSFDKAKAGQFLKKYIEESGFSQRQLAQHIGMTDDMLSNVLRGQNKEISLERVFKICIATGHSICDFIREMLENEEIDFRSEFDAVCPPHSVDLTADSANLAAQSVPHGIAVRQVEVVSRQTEVLETPNPAFKSFDPGLLDFLRADRKEQSDRANALHDKHLAQVDANYRASIARYEKQIDIINHEHAKSVDEMKSSHAETVGVLNEMVKSYKNRSKWLGSLLLAETLGIIGLFVYDALHLDRGWLQSVLHLHSSMFESFRG